MGEYLVEMNDITVQFPGVLALDHVHFNAKRGEVHVLLGENGAGKSTIMKVLAGVNTNYEGEIIWKGEKITARSVEEQRARGVSIIFQELNQLKNLTVAENIFMGRQPTKMGGQVDWKTMNRRARELLDSIHSDISEKAQVSSLSVGQMQMVEIAKALSFDCDIIIMDEPTSALTKKEVNSLFEIIADLKKKGVAIVYISHRLEEIMKIGDRLTIFRDGKYIDTVNVKDITIDQMVAMMVGRAFNGIMISKFKLQPMIATLAMMSMARGAAYTLADGQTITGYSDAFRWIGVATIPGTQIPVQIIFMILLYILFYYIMKYRKFGRYIYSIGGNEEATRLSGINVDKYKTLAYMVSGLCAGIASVILVAKLNSAQSVAGLDYEMDAIASCVIGGTSLLGGFGSVWGTFVGSIIMIVIRNGLNLLNVSSNLQKLVIGIVILLAVLADSIRNKAAAKK